MIDVDDPKFPLSPEERLEAAVRERTAELSARNARLADELKQQRAAAELTARQNAALEQRIAELQALFDIAPVGIGIASDIECRVVRTNPAFAEILGLPPEANASATAPHNFQILKDGVELAPEAMPMRRAMAEGLPVRNFEETIIRADGSKVELLVNTVPIRDASGQIRGCIGTYQDITTQQKMAAERIESERRLQEIQKLESIGVLAGGVAHDFNNLLTAILGYTHLLRQELPPETTAQTMLARVENSARQAAELCKQLLAYAGKGNYAMRPTSLNEVIRKAADSLDSSRPDVRVRLALGDDLPKIRGDVAQLRQLFLNLFTNATEAMEGRAGEIVIRTGAAEVSSSQLATFFPGHSFKGGSCVFVEVTDEGSGMDQATQARIFEPFFTTKFVGRGLGLPAALGIIHGHRGAISVRSQAGVGTSVQLFLPVDASSAAPLPAVGPARDPKATLSVLVVDDEPAIREFAGAVLSRAGFSVVTACDGAEAVGLVRGHPQAFAAVMLDLTMPRLNGEDTLRMLRELNPRLPAVLVSGYSESMVHERFAGADLVEVLSKPFAPEAVVSLMKAVIRRAESVSPAA